MPSASRVIQVTNVAPAATREQMKTLFGFLGRIDDLVIYPELETMTMPTKICFVKFSQSEDVGVALHLTNTVFIDRALIVVPVPDGKIPDEKTALSSPTSQYPVLPASTELAKVDEIRRTVYVANIDATVSPETLMQFFGAQAGEVKFARMAGDESSAVHAAFIEFTDQVSVVRALSLAGQVLGSRLITVVPANTAIVKPATGLPVTSSDEAVRKVGDVQPSIDAAVDADANGRRSSRSKSRSRHRRSRSRSHESHSTRRSRSHRSRSRHRSGSRSQRSRRRSSSRSPRRKTPSPPKRRRSRSKSRDRKRPKSRSPSPKPSRAVRRSRSPGRRDRRDDRKSKSRSPSKASRDGSSYPDRDSRRHAREDVSRGHKDGSRRSPMRSPVVKKSRSRSKSPGSHGLKKERSSRHSESSRDRGAMDRDRKRESDGRRERESKDGRHERESRDKKDRSDHKSSSSKHRRDKEPEKNKKQKSAKVGRDSDEEDEDDEKSPQRQDEGSEEEDVGGNEEEEHQSGYEGNPSDNEENEEPRGKSPSDANLSRLDMDVDSE